MGRVWAIAINTFREAVRDKVLYGVLSFAVLVLFFSLALAELSLNQQRRVVLDIGIASISFFSVVIAIFLGSSLLYKEIERKTLYVILPKPIRRWEFLAGKYVGIVVTALVFIAIMGAIQLWVTAVQADAPAVQLVGLPVAALALLAFALWRAKDRTAVLLPWSLAFLAGAAAVLSGTDVAVAPLLGALSLIFGEVIVVSAVALLFSSFSTPFLTGAFTLGVWVVGRNADLLAAMRDRALGPALAGFLRGLARVVPNLHLFVPGRHALDQHAATPSGLYDYVGTTMAYGLGYALLLFVIASLIFRRRDFL
ncbi:MAG: ABC transporter permease [Sandaracinaceae bacterium]|nr:ABC transporter permease [Sandaracinaceae bacterium]